MPDTGSFYFKPCHHHFVDYIFICILPLAYTDATDFSLREAFAMRDNTHLSARYFATYQ